MRPVRTFGIAAFTLIGVAILFRLVITFTGSSSDSTAELSGIMIGLGGGAILCWGIYALVTAPVARLLTKVSRTNPEAAVFIVVTDEFLDSALNELGIERARKSRFIALVANQLGVQLQGSRRKETIATFEWAMVEGFSVGSATSRWSSSAWSNIVMHVHGDSETVGVPLSAMPGRSGGNYTSAQMRTVIDAIVAKRPPSTASKST